MFVASALKKLVSFQGGYMYQSVLDITCIMYVDGVRHLMSLLSSNTDKQIQLKQLRSVDIVQKR